MAHHDTTWYLPFHCGLKCKDMFQKFTFTTYDWKKNPPHFGLNCHLVIIHPAFSIDLDRQALATVERMRAYLERMGATGTLKVRIAGVAEAADVSSSRAFRIMADGMPDTEGSQALIRPPYHQHMEFGHG